MIWRAFACAILLISLIREISAQELTCPPVEGGPFLPTGNYTISSDITCLDQFYWVVEPNSFVGIQVLTPATLTGMRFSVGHDVIESQAPAYLYFSGASLTLAGSTVSTAFYSPQYPYEPRGGAVSIAAQQSASYVVFENDVTMTASSPLACAGTNSLIFKNTAIFVGNTEDRPNDPGALAVSAGCSTTFESSAVFVGNSGDKGGAVSVDAGSTLTFMSQVLFENNTAVRGGAVSIEGVLDCWGNATFAGNTAIVSGGSLWSFTLTENPDVPYVNFYGPVTFTASSALRGRVLNFGGTGEIAITTFFSTVIFDGNAASPDSTSFSSSTNSDTHYYTSQGDLFETEDVHTTLFFCNGATGSDVSNLPAFATLVAIIPTPQQCVVPPMPPLTPIPVPVIVATSPPTELVTSAPTVPITGCPVCPVCPVRHVLSVGGDPESSVSKTSHAGGTHGSGVVIGAAVGGAVIGVLLTSSLIFAVWWRNPPRAVVHQHARHSPNCRL